jgi:hypothetical protein
MCVVGIRLGRSGLASGPVVVNRANPLPAVVIGALRLVRIP